MDKAELLNAILSVNGEQDHRSAEAVKAWANAMNEYQRITGRKLDRACSGCRKEILTWLRG